MTDVPIPDPALNNKAEVFWLFRISFLYYSLIGFVTLLLVAYPVSILTGGYEAELDESLLTPLFRSKRYKEQQKRNDAQYRDLGTALQELRTQNEE